MNSRIIFALFLLCPVLATAGQQQIDCTAKSSTQDRLARIAIETKNGSVQSFAFYSKWKPRTCSIDAERGDSKSSWVDSESGNTTTVSMDKGSLLIQRTAETFKFQFINFDMMKYCGMDGALTGSLTVQRKSQSQCEAVNLMPAPSH